MQYSSCNRGGIHTSAKPYPLPALYAQSGPWRQTQKVYTVLTVAHMSQLWQYRIDPCFGILETPLASLLFNLGAAGSETASSNRRNV